MLSTLVIKGTGYSDLRHLNVVQTDSGPVGNLLALTTVRIGTESSLQTLLQFQIILTSMSSQCCGQRKYFTAQLNFTPIRRKELSGNKFSRNVCNLFFFEIHWHY